MRKKGTAGYDTNSILMSSVSFRTIEEGKMCKHKHALKGQMIRGVQKRRSSPDPRLIQIQLFLSSGKQSPLFISHMAWPPVLLTQDREMLRKPCEDMRTSMGKIILSTKSPSGSDLELYSFCRFGIAELTTSGFIGCHFVLHNTHSGKL